MGSRRPLWFEFSVCYVSGLEIDAMMWSQEEVDKSSGLVVILRLRLKKKGFTTEANIRLVYIQ